MATVRLEVSQLHHPTSAPHAPLSADERLLRGTLHAQLDAAIAPASIALVGASEQANKIGGRPLVYLKRFGYQGRVYPINPARELTQGLRTWASLASLPEVPDMVIVAVAGDAAIEAVAQAARLGVKLALVMSSGFGETDAAGRAREQAMVAIARRHGLRIVGPNTQGLANFGNGAVASFSTMFTETEPADGPVGIVSQSGALSVVPYHLLRTRSVGVRHVHATGNDSDATACEMAAVVARDPDLRLLLLYLEGLPDPWNLAQAARIARRRGLPIVALKSGSTPAGQQAAQSHTGSLATEDRVVDAFMAQHGIWRVRSVNELVDAAPLYLKGWRPAGRRIVVISNSGAVCVLAADAASRAGLQLPALSADTREQLGRILPGFATTTNPVDITAALLSNSSLFGQILPVIADDPAADAFVIGIPVAGAGYDVDLFARDAAAFAERTGKPVVVAAPQDSVAACFRARGLPVYVTEDDAVRALAQFIGHSELMAQVNATGDALDGRWADAGPRRLGAGAASADAGADPAVVPGADPAGQPSPAQTLLNENDSLRVLAGAGVPVVAHRLCGALSEALAAAADIGYPVVLKGCSSLIAHKSDLGLVQLNLADAAALGRAHAAIGAAARSAGLVLDGMLVAAMVGRGRELMLGARRDPVFGTVLLVGDGGAQVEVLPDARLLLAPFDVDSVRQAVSQLRIAPLLGGFRGSPARDVEAFCAAAVRLGRWMEEGDHTVLSVDINPVIVGPVGQGCLAADAVVFQAV
jgi:acyl-CoA synthetase (NDP forming)